MCSDDDYLRRRSQTLLRLRNRIREAETPREAAQLRARFEAVQDGRLPPAEPVRETGRVRSNQ